MPRVLSSIVLLSMTACTEARPKPDPVHAPVEPEAPAPRLDVPPVVDVPPVRAPTPPLTDAKDLRFVLEEYNWEVGGSTGIVFEYPATLTVVWVHGEEKRGVVTPVFERSSTVLSDDEADSVIAALERASFFELDENYINRNIEDGYSDDYRLRAHGKTHAVHCGNETPQALRTMLEVLRPLQRAHERDGAVMTRDELKTFWDAFEG